MYRSFCIIQCNSLDVYYSTQLLYTENILRVYTTQKYGKDFPYRTQLESQKESQYTPAELQADIERRQAINRKQKQSAARIARNRRGRGRSGRGFRGYQRTGRDSKGMTTRARVNPKDIIGSI